jgi:ribonuclease-3
MSQLCLHEHLNLLFESRDISHVADLFNHQQYANFILKYSLNISSKDLAQAFTHTSFSHEYQAPHQEQLEFLGDSVLQLILTDELFRRFPLAKEGHLSKLRSAIVNEKSLSAIALGLGLDDLIIVGKGEFKKRLFEQAPVLADTFEALLAQIYRYHGLDFTKTLFLSWLDQFISHAFDENFLDSFDSKSKLQEKVLAKYKKLPRYSSELKGEEFEITLWINDIPEAKGIFVSKKNGEKELAQEVLKKGII